MSRLSINDLPMPADEYRIDLHPGRPLDRFGNPQAEFETPDQSRREDWKRADLLRAGTWETPPLFRRVQALRLGHSLFLSKPPPTLASSRYFRNLRIKFGGAAARLVMESCWHPDRVSVFTANPRTWEYEPRDLNRVDPRSLMQSFRTELVRNGAAEADGFLIAALHGEFEPGQKVYVLHTHGIAAGGMVDVLDSLREVDNYKANSRGYLPGSTNVRTRLKISREPLTDHLYALTYPLKSYWPSKLIGEFGEDGAIKRQRDHHRLPEPYHTQVLLWLDRWSLSDITLLMKVRVGPDGFVLTGTQADS